MFFGENHPVTAESYDALGCLQLRMKNFTSALKLFQRALDITLNFYEENHPITAEIYNNIGNAQKGLQDLTSAFESH